VTAVGQFGVDGVEGQPGENAAVAKFGQPGVETVSVYGPAVKSSAGDQDGAPPFPMINVPTCGNV